MLRIRDAGPGDFEAVAALLAELGRPAVLGGPAQDEHHARYLEWLQTPGLHLFVAEDDGRVVGMIDLEFLPRPNFETPMAWVPDLIVSDEHRSKGAGAALLARAEEVAREAGAWALALESANWRTRAHDFYVREGMADSAHSFTKVLRTDLGWPPAPPQAASRGASPGSNLPEGFEVRPGEEADLEEVNEIYNHYVRTSHATFDLEPATMDQRKEWFGHFAPTGPHRLLVGVAGGRVLGYATSSPYRTRPAYLTSVETSAYVTPDATGRGVGAVLYRALLDALAGEDV